MPITINGLTLPIMPAGYSSGFLERTCVLVADVETSTGLQIKLYHEKDYAFACVVNATPNSEGRHDVISKVELNQTRVGWFDNVSPEDAEREALSMVADFGCTY